MSNIFALLMFEKKKKKRTEIKYRIIRGKPGKAINNASPVKQVRKYYLITIHKQKGPFFSSCG